MPGAPGPTRGGLSPAGQAVDTHTGAHALRITASVSHASLPGLPPNPTHGWGPGCQPRGATN